MGGVRVALAIAVTVTGCGSDGPELGEPEPQPLPTPAEVRDELTGLDFGPFIERSFELLLQRSPMSVVELGLEAEIDVGESFLDDVSDRFAAETREVEEIVLDLLGEFDGDALDGDQRVAFEAYSWYLDDRVRGHAFADLEYRVTPGVNSMPVTTRLFFTDVHPVASAGDADRYVRRLAAVGPQMRQVRDVMRRLEEDGIMTPRLLLSWSRPGIRDVALAQPRSNPFYLALERKLGELADAEPDAIDSAARERLLDRAAEAIADSVIPGYRALDELLAEQEARAPETVGAWQYPDGDAYYAQALRHHVTTEVTAAELHQLGLDELDRIHGEMAVLFAELGYPEGAAVDQQIARVAADGGQVAEGDVVAEYTAIIEDAQGRLSEAFDIVPSAGVVVTGVRSGGFYIGPSLDDSRPGAFFASVPPSGEDRFGMRTLAYHEAVPGHHLQIGIAHDLDLPLFQRVVTFTGFVEGWALYAEWLAGDLGWYEGDIHGDVGRLQAEAFRAARLVVDTGIHDLEWSFGQAVDFFREATGFSQGAAEGQIARYASWPGQATSYWMGRTAILALRAEAEAALGADFDPIAFHRAVLVHGSVPLDVLAANVESDLALP